MAVPAYAKPALNSMKVLAATKKNTPEAKAASVIVGKRMRSLRRRNALWAGALALAAVGGVAAYKHRKGTLQLPAIPAGTLTVVRSAAGRASASTAATFRSAYASITTTMGRKPVKKTNPGSTASLVQRGKNKNTYATQFSTYMWPPPATAAPSIWSRFRR
jgi:hypothetical protein